MAFVFKNLRKINGDNSIFWNYWTLEDTVLTVKQRNYFEPAKTRFAVGDWIFVTAITGSTILHVDEIDPLEMGVPQ